MTEEIKKVAKPTSRMSAALIRNMVNLQKITGWTNERHQSEISQKLAVFCKEEGLRLRMTRCIEGEWFNGKFPESARICIITDQNTLVIVFRGTKSKQVPEFITNIAKDLNALRKHDLDFISKDLAFKRAYRKIGVHRGFYKEYERYRSEIIKYVNRNPRKEIFVTGHSMGAGLATLCSFDIAVNKGRKVNGYFYGSPRVGGEDFRQAFNKEVPNAFVINLHDDPITKIPPSALFNLYQYRHVGRMLLLFKTGKQVPLNRIDVTLDISAIVHLAKIHSKVTYEEALHVFARDYGGKKDRSGLIRLSDTSKEERRLARHWAPRRLITSWVNDMRKFL